MVSAAPRQGIELKLEIIRQGLKVETVAARCGVTRQHLGRVLNGHVEMYDKLARDLAFALKIKKERIWELWRGKAE